MPAKYTKQALSTEEQVQLLKGRGMLIADEEQAKHVLLTCNYYRLRGYWIPFEEREAQDAQDHKFKPGTRFEDVVALYLFDEALRNLIIAQLGKLEISVRTSFAYHLSRAHGALAYRDPELFNQKEQEAEEWWDHAEFLDKMDKDFRRSHETFAKKLLEKYTHPPIWAVIEVMTFRQLSLWLSNLRKPEPRRSIAADHGFNHAGRFCGFIHAASVLRNICAHHGRLTHRILGVMPKHPYYPEELMTSWWRDQSSAYNLLTMLEYVIKHIRQESGFGKELKSLSLTHSVNLSVLGFPDDWEQRPVWCAA